MAEPVRETLFIENVFPACVSVLGDRGLTLSGERVPLQGVDEFPEHVRTLCRDLDLPPWLPDLAELELSRFRAGDFPSDISEFLSPFALNPSVDLLASPWRIGEAYARFLERGEFSDPEPVKGSPALTVTWKDPDSKRVRTAPASPEDLLVLKMLTEDIPPEEAARTGGVPVGAVDRALWRGVWNGLLLAAPSRIRRDPAAFATGAAWESRFRTVSVFTVQWHITHACDLHCRHCYDRSMPSPLTLDQGIQMLDDLRTFCGERHVRGNVCFTGGNPFLHRDFPALYRAATEKGFSLSILGNPVSRERLEEILAIQEPTYFQVSLEGLPLHNDYMRGEGHFERVIGFLRLLRQLGIESSVMLTLTRDNIDQVLPLAEQLRDEADYFTFNRLSPVGEGVCLSLPDPDVYRSFLAEYWAAEKTNPILGFKDNLINIIRHQRGEAPYGGCTGYGCGAAFNFIAVLPDGEAHACRKFPSPIGNVLGKGVAGVYDSASARRYRRGSDGCRGCTLQAACGGCMSIAGGLGKDVFTERDPMCFMPRD